MTDADATGERYARFARDEAPGRSALYADWAAGAASDPAVLAVLARIPASHRQPPLVFAVTRLLGAPEAPFPEWAGWLLAHADAVVAECGRRTVQTNEPLRSAVLLPALSLLEGPIALLEVGASAGLCLYPDRYSYRYRGAEGIRSVDPADGPTRVVLDCRVEGAPPARMPQIVARHGIDLQPLDARDPMDRRWLEGLVWPGEDGRVERVRAALDVAAADPPSLVAGDAADLIPEVAARVRRAAPEATLVVTTPGVLAHVPRAGRERIIAAAREAGRWITLDAPSLHDAWTEPVDVDAWPRDGFALALDGDVLAAVDPLGGWIRWASERRAPVAGGAG
ncbi:hypothetical protein LK09_06675 [Microbacterium mangrovi]|uniref:DUF2332 domain-containing protein n=1 Tax=Microbacterium mangrovi TaxID=1348253 RepID=A0A0B2A538_9MICO|nr:DUF2332 domain-containing protein [Microbacterium mangrovi]KHK98629.1 hypothetical protein LK09_06675 [Microbacterium mangrovi]